MQILSTAFLANPFLNGIIVFVFVVGVLFAFRQVLRLYPEIRWVNAFRIAGTAQPALQLSRRRARGRHLARPSTL